MSLKRELMKVAGKRSVAKSVHLEEHCTKVESTGAHLAGGWGGGGGVQGVRTPALFSYKLNCALKFLDQFRRNALKNQFKKRKNPSK